MNGSSGVAEGALEKSRLAIAKAQKVEVDKKDQLKEQDKAIDEVINKMRALETSIKALDEEKEVLIRKAGVGITDDPILGVKADETALRGTTTFEITQLATKTSRDGAADVGQKVNSTADVSGVTISSMSLSTPVTEGTFTVNGAQITVSTTDTLETVLNGISTATGGVVTGAYNPTTDKIDLTGSANITLGSAGDTSNFLNSMKLFANGTTSVSSESQLGAVKTYTTIDNANLTTTPTSGTFKINGYSFNYDVSTDNLGSLMATVNSSDAGVDMSYDSVLDKFTLRNKVTGNLDLAVEDTSGNLLEAIGLNSSSTLSTGVNAQFKVNGGSTLTSPSNDITSAYHGVSGLTVTAKQLGTDTVTISQDTAAVRTKIDDFIAKYNQLQAFISDKTKVTVTGSEVKKGPLTDIREVNTIGIDLRKKIYEEVDTLAAGTIKRLADIGIDFKTDSSSYKNLSNELYVKDETVFSTALDNDSQTVSKLFTDTTDGLAKVLKDFLAKELKNDGSDLDKKSALFAKKLNLTAKIKSVDEKIQKYEDDFEKLKKKFIEADVKMQQAQAKMQQAQQSLASLYRQ